MIKSEMMVQNQPDLHSVLDISLQNQGTVYVSPSGLDPLPNSLFLNIKNKSGQPLYTDEHTRWPGKPTMTVKFVYGSFGGDLLPATDPPLAYNISAAFTTNHNWSLIPPGQSSSNPDPEWDFYPHDIAILDAGANLSISFNDIVTYNPTGHTQMIITFTGFMANATTPYPNTKFLIDIVMLPPPPTRGVQSFFSTQSPVITLDKPTAALVIPLQWSMYYVDKITVISNIPGLPPTTVNYYKVDGNPPIQPLAYDSLNITLPGTILQDTAVFFTIQAFDNAGNFLNALPFTLFFATQFVTDRAGTVYKTVLLNNQTWMAENYAYNSGPPDAVNYDNLWPQPNPAGMLYTLAQALANAPDGWRLPTLADWQGLFNSFGSPTDAYNALIDKGSSGFNAQLGGMCENTGSFNSSGDLGIYWSANPVQGGNNEAAAGFADNAEPAMAAQQREGLYYVGLFSKSGLNVNATNQFNADWLLSVRYVRNY